MKATYEQGVLTVTAKTKEDQQKLAGVIFDTKEQVQTQERVEGPKKSIRRKKRRGHLRNSERENIYKEMDKVIRANVPGTPTFNPHARAHAARRLAQMYNVSETYPYTIYREEAEKRQKAYLDTDTFSQTTGGYVR